MPFVQGGGSVSGEPGGAIGSGLPAATLVVQPDKLLRLKHRFEDRREKVRNFIKAERQNLVNVPPPGADPCSEGVAEALSQNGQTALDAAQGFVGQLGNVIDGLDEAARLYGLVEESNTDKFRQGPG